MCLSTLYEITGSDRKMLARNIESVKNEEGKLVFTDLLGAKTVIDGSIEQIDLTENYIVVKRN